MPSNISTPHCPFDRLWQPGHPFRARRSRCRRWTMALLLIFISGIISSYWYLTDPNRIRQMSQAYLSELVGGHVEIGSASLTVMEGLKLSHIKIKVDKAGAVDDTTVFTADAIEIQYNPASLLRGKLDATRIIATGAKAKLVEDAAAGHWNYQRLIPPSTRQHPVSQPAEKEPLRLPQLVMRDAEVQYSDIQGDQLIPRGSVALEGILSPSADGSRYSFELQSRGQFEGVGPVVSGQVIMKGAHFSATLKHLRFGPDVEAMLPREVRDFWLAHKVEGALDINKFSYTPATATARATFDVQIELKHVKLVVRAEEFDPPPQFASSKKSPGNWLPLDAVTDVVHGFQTTLHRMHGFPQHAPLSVDDVSGEFFFDQDGMHFDAVNGTVAGATLAVSGKIDGYSPDAPIRIRVESKPGEVVNIPENPDYLVALPGPLHEAYNMLKPHGAGTMWAEMVRTTPTAMPVVNGEINIVDGYFNCIFFPYPVQHAVGKIRFFPDPSGTFEKVSLDDIHGRGVPGGPNANRQVCVAGWVGAMNPDVGCRIHAYGTDMQSEPELFAAFPPPVRKVMDIFRGPGEEKIPHFAGDFDCVVFVPPGVNMRPIVSVDLNFKDGAGKMTAFPYPVEQLRGDVHVRDGYVDLNDVHATHGRSAVTINGRVTWPVDMPPGAEVIAKPDLRLVAGNIPIDNDLIRALPPEARSWLHTLGATGLLDVDGKILPKPNATRADDSIAYDLNLGVHDGSAKPRGTDFGVSAVAGKLIVHADRLEILDMHGKRGDADLSATGAINWSTGGADVRINATGTGMKTEPALREMLPPEAQAAWKTLDPHGVFDARVQYHGNWRAVASEPIASIKMPIDSVVTPPPPDTNEFDIQLHPVDVSIMPAPLPYRLDHCKGDISITPVAITITNVQAKHGKASIVIGGKGITSNPNNWDLNLSAHDLTVNDELKTALPLPIRQVLDELKYQGELSVDLPTFRYRGDKPDPDIDFVGTLSAAGGSVDVGITMDKIGGSVPFTAFVRNGKLAAFHGDAALDQFNMSARPITNFKAALDLPSGSDVLHVTGIRGNLGGGEVAGSMDLKFPDVGNSSYLMNFAVKNSDLRDIAQQVAARGQEVRGQLSASLALQGEWANPATRRGRGDVVVSGKEMYQIPLLLGLLEVTNLSLPTSSPFNEGTARYLVEGNRVTFEQVQMRSNDMVMSGNGWLDFGNKQVRMNFTTENPNLPQVPLIHDLWQGAKQELLQIQVRGTVQAPKVSAASLHTFTTTVDEVLNGSGKEK